MSAPWGYFPSVSFDQLERPSPSSTLAAPTHNILNLQNNTQFNAWLTWTKKTWNDIRADKKKNGKHAALFQQYYQAFVGDQEEMNPLKKLKVDAEFKDLPQHLVRKKLEDRIEKQLQTLSKAVIAGDKSTAVEQQTLTPLNLPFLEKLKPDIDRIADEDIGTYLMIWDFLHTFSDVFQRSETLNKFSFEDFLKCLETSNNAHLSYLLSEIIMTLTHVLRIQAPKRGTSSDFEDNRKNHPIVLNNMTWPHILKQFIIEYQTQRLKKKRSEQIENYAEDEASLPDFGDTVCDSLIQKCTQGHSALFSSTMTEKKDFLEFLMDESTSSYILRKCIEKRVEIADQTEASRQKKRAEDLKIRNVSSLV
jgi:hypothetical protein